MGGKSKKTTTSTYRPARWVESTAQQAIGIGRRIGSQQYQSYDADRVAGLSENERLGIEMAQGSTGLGMPYIDKASEYASRGTESWADADQSKYINPYIKGALDPAARELREYSAGALRDIEDRASSMDAWGRRSGLAKADVTEKTMQGLSDLYGEGYARAYEWGAQLFGMERARDMDAAGRFAQIGGQVQDMAVTDISTLMTTGATDRSIQQAALDFDWQQFVEERDWGFRQLMGVISALEGTKGSYTTTQTTEEVKKSNNAAQVVGAIAQVVAAMYTGGASLAVTGGLQAASGASGSGPGIG